MKTQLTLFASGFYSILKSEIARLFSGFGVEYEMVYHSILRSSKCVLTYLTKKCKVCKLIITEKKKFVKLYYSAYLKL